MTAYARGFRLHVRGRVLDGAEFPNGRVIVVDDPEWGLCSGARSADLLQVCYPGSRIEWPPAETSAPPDEQPCTDPRHTGAIRDQLGCSGPDPATTT
ncbi:hypothetical protein [Streptomyces sp. NPDC048438]|uniref:hypothetical protein n=1 Tax=Streptomyces sp. NPDC048438 TaxID=3365551 RepID=UPI00372020FE